MGCNNGDDDDDALDIYYSAGVHNICCTFLALSCSKLGHECPNLDLLFHVVAG